MANSFSQIYIQIVFSVKFREPLLQKPWRDDVFKYIAGIISNKKQKAIIVNGVSDHVHVFIGYKPAMPLPDLVRDIKNNSSAYINDRGLTPGKLHGRRAMQLFHILIHIFRMYTTTSLTKKLIIQK
jgi:putative transposase